MSIAKYILILGLNVLIAAGCNSTIENKGFESKLAKVEVGSAFVLDTINTKVQWDQLYIVGPYQYEAVNKKVNISSRIKNTTLTEGNCVLVFVKEKQVVDYLSVPRSVVDFCDSNNNGDFNDDTNAIRSNAVFILTEGRKAVLEEVLK